MGTQRELDDDLVAEGTARELVNRIQNLRKNNGLNVTDRIKISVEEKPMLRSAVEQFGDYIKAETLADEINVFSFFSIPDIIDSAMANVEWLEGEMIGIGITR